MIRTGIFLLALLACLLDARAQQAPARYLLHGNLFSERSSLDSARFESHIGLRGGRRIGRYLLLGAQMQASVGGNYLGGAPPPFRRRFLWVDQLSAFAFLRAYAGRTDSVQRRVLVFAEAAAGGLLWSAVPLRDPATGALAYNWQQGLDWSLGAGLSWWVHPCVSLEAQVGYSPFIERGRGAFVSQPHRIITQLGFSCWLSGKK
jgi:hypothetical protein